LLTLHTRVALPACLATDCADYDKITEQWLTQAVDGGPVKTAQVTIACPSAAAGRRSLRGVAVAAAAA
jgi:hypothetical protein